MRDQDKTKDELISELTALRQQIADLKEAERALPESDERVRHLLEHVGEAGFREPGLAWANHDR